MEEHISIKDLINFAKGSVPESFKDEQEKSEYERIALHLGDCAECLERLAEIRYTISDYDNVWEKIFPSPSLNEIEQQSIPESKVLDWISEAAIIRELGVMLADIGNRIRTNILSLTGYYIPAMETAYGMPEVDSVPIYYLKSSGINLIDSVEIKDNNLVFHFKSDTGYKKICIAGPNQIRGIADIINYNPGKYSATFPKINTKPEGLFVHLY